MNFRNLDRCLGFRILKDSPIPMLKKVLTVERVREFEIAISSGLKFNYAAKKIDKGIIDTLQRLADEQELVDKYKALLSGELVNTSEKRMVLHHLMRGELNGNVIAAGKNLFLEYQEQFKSIAKFTAAVHEAKILGSTGKVFTDVVQIGIGGSDLGPRALYIALKNIVSPKMQAHFISNVDPDDANYVLATINPETTLFILVSKSGTTQETLTNREIALGWLKQNKAIDPAKHMVAVTSSTSPMANNPDYLDSFYIDDNIGGRYSATSAVGGAILSLALGSDVFKEILNGAHEADELALNPDIRKNAALMDALIGIFERNVCSMSCTAVLPYSQALARFPAHLQQLDMESNGKHVNRDGRPISYDTGPIILGEPGTNGQHSFYQHLHQGTTVVPIQFIGFQESQLGNDHEFQGSGSQTKLKANLVAQVVAFAMGHENDDPNKDFVGERPSSLIHAKQLTPRNLGALLAHFENKVMFQGFAWNINSFDQEGVQLGKVLTTELLNGAGSETLKYYFNLLS